MMHKCPICGDEHALTDHPTQPGRVVLYHGARSVLEFNKPKRRRKPKPPPEPMPEDTEPLGDFELGES